MAKNEMSNKIKKVIAAECGLPYVTNKTAFMEKQTLSYFDCMAALYTLQHKFDVSLPESDFSKYATVGALTRCVLTQIKQHNK